MTLIYIDQELKRRNDEQLHYFTIADLENCTKNVAKNYFKMYGQP